MAMFDPATLAELAGSDDLHISPFRDDGTTYGTPTWIWSVVVDEQLYVRAYNGTKSRWYQAAMSQRAGRIRGAGATHEVIFEAGTNEVTSKVNRAYEEKYAGSPYLPPMLTDAVVTATVQISPR